MMGCTIVSLWICAANHHADGPGRFNYTGNNQTYKMRTPFDTVGTKNCMYSIRYVLLVVRGCSLTQDSGNQTLDITIGPKTYSVLDLNITSVFCWEGRGYDYTKTRRSTRCLPDTANPSYEWGFSVMLVSVFFIAQFSWALSMYIVWQDAQFNSKLIKSGFRLTELGAAFVVAEAAKRKTGLEGEELIRMDEQILKRELYGDGKKMGAVVDKEILWEDGLVLRKRGVVDEIDER
jgi:hypothetical protein